MAEPPPPSDPRAQTQPPAGRWDERTIDPDAAGEAPAGASERQYLLVFQRDSSSLFQLPRTGEVLIGRADGAQLRLMDSSVSRTHAKVFMTGGEAEICDLGSSNGTRVNGERVAGSRRLASGDVVTICNVTLVFHSSVRAEPARVLVDAAYFHQRTEEEVERCLRYDRPLTVVVIAGTTRTDLARLALALGPPLRLMDVVGTADSGHLLVLMPEVGAQEAAAAARRLLDAIRLVVADARLGYACCPVDGCDVDALIGAARAAALEARAGAVAASTQSFRTVEVGPHRIVVADPAMLRLYTLIERLAASDLPVLVYGETGTGKELAATALHEWSARRSGPLVAFNCAALQETLVESELFGYERGAFSGAVGAKPGLLERGAGGTVLLDEVGELPPTAQAKLLRVLETKRVMRLGDVRERDIDIRVVAATNRNLDQEVREGRFRQDLFFRLSGGMLWLPPLRDRKQELRILAGGFLAEACARAGVAPMGISDAGMRTLLGYAWPGNIRELKNLMEYAAAAVRGPLLEPEHILARLAPASGGAARPAVGEDTLVPDVPAPTSPRFRPIDDEVRELERSRMEAALAATGGNQTRAAELIAMPLRTFQAKIKAYGLTAPDSRRR
jgi:DNA-binding NtrC family response regulator/pSer/pThr/pTyr-binding forkhead associated (FHA) protein